MSLTRRTRLRVFTPLRATRPLGRRSPLAAAPGTPAKPLGRPQKPQKAPRDTGPPQKTRNLVLARDNWQCAGCGKPVGGGFTWWSLQHRKARGTGGDNSPANLLVLCGSATSPGCHRKCEDRLAEMHDRGLWVRSTEDAALVPVTYWDGRTAWLTADGGLIYEAGAA